MKRCASWSKQRLRLYWRARVHTHAHTQAFESIHGVLGTYQKQHLPEEVWEAQVSWVHILQKRQHLASLLAAVSGRISAHL